MKRNVLVFVLVVALLTGLVAVPVMANDEKPYIAMIALGYGHQFWQAVRMVPNKLQKSLE